MGERNSTTAELAARRRSRSGSEPRPAADCAESRTSAPDDLARSTMLMARAPGEAAELNEQQHRRSASLPTAGADVLGVGGGEHPHGPVAVLEVVEGGEGEDGHVDVVQPPVPIPGRAEAGRQV